MNFITQVPASCGELIQGFLDGNEFLVNSPIPMFASAEVKLSNSSRSMDSLKDAGYLKVARVLEALLEKFCNNKNIFFDVQINSKIPRNKGLSSSTAEISAALLGAIKTLNLKLNFKQIAQLIIDVDGSSDAVFLEGITITNQLKGDTLHQYKKIPNLSFIIVDAGGEVQTQEFDRKFARWVATEHQFSLRRAVKLLHDGFSNQNARLISHAATISARINQYILYKSPFNTLLEGTQEWGGLGVNCAHTGTVLGVMFDHTQTDSDVLRKRVEELIHPLPILGVYPLISGMGDVVLNSENIFPEANSRVEEHARQFKLA